MKITNDIVYVGVNDHKIDLFEGQYKVKNGMSYNSYIILDEKIAVMDTVDVNFTKEWLKNIKDTLGEKEPDYLIIQHMEPDHSANIDKFMECFPNVTIVSNQKSFAMMQQYFGTDYNERRLIVGEGDTLSLGKHTLTFVMAPMVHWPEVMVTYDSCDRVLFSADGFGKFGALDVDEEWADEARRYYIGIVGRYGAQTQALLKKASNLDIAIICPLHGPVLSENLEYYLDLYNTWSSYEAEKDGVVVAYTSVYGNTKKAAQTMAEILKNRGVCVKIHDLARCDCAEAVADAFCYSRLILATTTYNGGIFPAMRDFIEHLKDSAFQNRTVAFIENGSWAPVAYKNMRAMLENSKNLTFIEKPVTIKSAMTEKNRQELEALADEIIS